MSADPALGIVYLPVESATGDRYGGDRPGANLYANSLVALEVKTGKMRWQYQIIHHDIWDWDNPSAPILADLPNGKKIVVQLTKQAFAYTFDRVDRRTDLADQGNSRTAVGRARVNGLRRRSRSRRSPRRTIVQGISEEDLIDFTPEVLAAAKDAIKPYRLEPALRARFARESEGRHDRSRSAAVLDGRRELGRRRDRSRDGHSLRAIAHGCRCARIDQRSEGLDGRRTSKAAAARRA